MSAAARAIFAGAVLLLLSVGGAWGDADPDATTETALGSPAADLAQASARSQAKLMHAVYASTLDAMHHHFFRNDRAVLPARAMEDVFADMERQTKIKAKWIAVNTRPMNIDHEPRSDFEKEAARALAAGKNEFERIEDGYYHRAGVIPLTSGCVNCHVGFFVKPPSTPRFAGLVIGVPLRRD